MFEQNLRRRQLRSQLRSGRSPVVRAIGRGLTAFSLLTVTASGASADPIFGPAEDPVADSGRGGQRDDTVLTPGFGARVGGYGFRSADGNTVWDDCRMNGVGVFGTLDFTPHFYGQLGFDLYHALPSVKSDEGMDRVSTHGLLGGGARMFPNAIATPFVEAGGGMEWTRVTLASGAEDKSVYPMGYLGFGGELNLTRRFKLGLGIRMLTTVHPRHEHSAAGNAESTTEHSHGLVAKRQALETSAGSELTMERDIAAQGLFFLRYRL